MYRFKGQPNIKALKLGLDVYDQIKANPNKKLWEIGMTLPQFQLELEEYQRGIEPEFTQRRVISSTVSRYEKRVRDSINKTVLGIFP
jgi:ABC-type phosphate/phosphonate transport system permease subunit